MNELHITLPSETDWERVDAMTDDEIDRSDSPPLGDDFFKRATVRWPTQATTQDTVMIVQVDPDVLAWFQALGSNYAEGINAALRIYAEAHKTFTLSVAKAA